MALEFDVSFQQAVAGINELTSRLSGLGREMDAMERNGVQGAQRYRDVLEATDGAARRLESTLLRQGVNAEAAGKVSEAAAKRANKALEQMAGGAVSAATHAATLRDRSSELRDTLLGTARDKTYIKYQERLAALHEQTTGKIALTRAELDNLNSAESRELLSLEAQRKSRRKSIQAMQSQASASENLRAIITQMVEAEREMAVTGQKVAWGYERMTQASAALTAQQQSAKAAVDAANRSMVEGEKNLERYTGANGQAAQAARRLAQEEDRAARARRDQMSALRQDIETRSKGKTDQAANQNAARLVEEQRREEAQRAKTLKDLRQAIEERYKADERAASVRSELDKAHQREIDKLRRLQTQSQLLTTDYGRQTAALQRQIHEQRAYNRLLTMSTAELLGFSSANSRATRGINASSQAAAMLRAGVTGLHASFGMYTSATIVAATATYAVAAALRDTVNAGMEFTETMSRAEAVMFSGTESIAAGVDSMKALEMQVRSLGQSTIFTATQVSEGLVDLGMAGLSGSESLSALKPTLDLASIGMIEMGTAADIATNVMEVFNKSAGDLPDVVNVLATAVTNANTNIEQLANALSYVGPAAKAAGFSMRDTVAAIELLSNAGIKSSKAGTGLRRMMMNILNPTAKGEAVMSKYGISVLDAGGNTRDLMDILGQFNKSLHADAISPGERTAAIMDLVGVRAASAVSRLVGSSQELGVLREQLDSVAGAADRMRAKIEDNLTADWKQVKSAFQDIQLDVFKQSEPYLRKYAAQLTTTLHDLQELDEGATDALGFDVTELDTLIARLDNLASAAGYAVAAFAGWKTFSTAGVMAGALSEKALNLQRSVSVLAQRTETASLAQTTFATRLTYAKEVIRGHTMAVTTASSATARLTALSIAGADAMRGLATAASMLMRALGWVGLIYGIGSAIYSAFGDTQDTIKDHRDNVKDLEDQYSSLQDQIKRTQHQANQEALLQRRDDTRLEIGATQDRISDLTGARDQTTNPQVVEQLTEKIRIAEGQVKNLKKELKDTNTALEELGSSQANLGSLQQQQDYMAVMLANTARSIDQLREAQAKVNSTSRNGLFKYSEELRSAAQAADLLRNSMALLSSDIEKVEAEATTFGKQLTSALDSQRSKLQSDYDYDQLNNAAKLVQKQKELAEVKAEVRRMDDAGVDAGADTYARAEKKAKDLSETVFELQMTQQEQKVKANEGYDDLLISQMTEEENLARIRNRLEEIQARRIEIYATSAVGGATTDYKELKDLIGEIVDLRGQEESILDDDGRDRKSEAERKLERARKSYERLQDEMDEVTAATRKFNDQQKMLDTLVQANELGQEDYNEALEHLRLKLYEAKRAADENAQALDRLNDSYLSSPFEKAVTDLVDLNRLLDEGVISMSKYEQIKDRINEKGIESVTQGAPEAEIGGLPDSASTPFGEYISTQMDRSEGLKEYSDRSSDLDGGYSREQDRIQRQAELREQALEAQQLSESEHAEKLKAIEQEKNQSLLFSQQQYNQQSAALADKQQKFAEESSKMVAISMVGSLANVFGMIADVGEDATAAQKAAFVAQKALTVAQILMYSHLAAARAPAEAGPILGIPLGTAILAQGYASAGLVAGLAVGQLSGAYDGGTSGSSGGGGGSSSYAGAYDKGGQIPSGQYGIVGEYGPEIVHGPANVTSRKDTAKKLGGGGGNLTIAPVFKVTVEGSQGQSDEEAKRTGDAISRQINTQFMTLLHKEMRQGGTLYRWKNS